MLIYLDPGIDTCSGFTLLVVCNRLTRPGRAGHGNLLCFYFCTVPAVLGNGLGICVIQAKVAVQCKK